MSKIVVYNVAEIPFYEGPHAIPGIKFRNARQTLGVTAWGMNVLEIDAGCTGYPTHDHQADGQEEVYLVLEGSVVLHTDVQTLLSKGDVVRVPPELTRGFTTETGVTLLALGGTPGAAYTVSPGM